MPIEPLMRENYSDHKKPSFKTPITISEDWREVCLNCQTMYQWHSTNPTNNQSFERLSWLSSTKWQKRLSRKRKKINRVRPRRLRGDIDNYRQHHSTTTTTNQNHKTRHTPATRAKPASEQNGKSITRKTSKVRTLCFRDTKEEKTIPLQPATHPPPTKQYDTETGAEDEKNHHLHALLSL